MGINRVHRHEVEQQPRPPTQTGFLAPARVDQSAADSNQDEVKQRVGSEKTDGENKPKPGDEQKCAEKNFVRQQLEFSFHGEFPRFPTAQGDPERWGETPSSPDLQRQKSGLDGVSPHRVHGPFPAERFYGKPESAGEGPDSTNRYG